MSLLWELTLWCEKLKFATQFLYLISSTLVRLSILFFYRRIFVTRNFRLAVYFMCVIVVSWFIAFFFASLLQIIPVSNNWSITASARKNQKQINEFPMYTMTAVTEILLDIIILAMPLFVIWRLQMRPAFKWQVSGMILLGTL